MESRLRELQREKRLQQMECTRQEELARPVKKAVEPRVRPCGRQSARPPSSGGFSLTLPCTPLSVVIQWSLFPAHPSPWSLLPVSFPPFLFYFRRGYIHCSHPPQFFLPPSPLGFRGARNATHFFQTTLCKCWAETWQQSQ